MTVVPRRLQQVGTERKYVMTIDQLLSKPSGMPVDVTAFKSASEAYAAGAIAPFVCIAAKKAVAAAEAAAAAIRITVNDIDLRAGSAVAVAAEKADFAVKAAMPPPMPRTPRMATGSPSEAPSTTPSCGSDCATTSR
jgi:hypothetical protein